MPNFSSLILLLGCFSLIAMAKYKSTAGARASRVGSVALKSAPRKRLLLAKSRPLRKPIGGSIYSVHPGIAMVEKWIGELKEKTGRSLDEWIKHIKHAAPPSEKDCRDWLKNAHGLGTNTAWWIGVKALGDPLKLVEDTQVDYLAVAA